LSGIAGILNLDGRPIERDLLRRMTDRMAYRGPDAQEIWADGEIGFGHALLRTTFESTGERQPWSGGGANWITADARLDARPDLIRDLASRGLDGLRTAPDAELVLLAYRVWEEECLDHLHGDFSFAVWDGRRRRLFCARDRLGVKPFFYAHRDGAFVFSNTLNVVRMHPAVRGDLNEAAIGDFLLFDFNQDLTTTSFADIRRLPPAHTLSVSADRPVRRRYWMLKPGDPIRYRRSGEYVEHFRAILNAAVSDRLRTDRAAVTMSGGLDSTSVAAVARRLLGEAAPPAGLRAFTAVYDKLVPDRERWYAGHAARSLGIPIRFLVLDDYSLFGRAQEPELATPEPLHDPLYAVWIDLIKAATEDNRIILEGQGGDIAFLFPRAYASDHLKNLRFLSLAAGVGRIALSRGRLPPVDFAKLKRWMGRDAPPAHDYYPCWLDKAFASRLDLPGRWKEVNGRTWDFQTERADALRALSLPFWPRFFEECDPNTVPFPLEIRYPLLDLRLLHFAFSIPVIPWIYDKYLLRRSMRGILPEPVRRRPKTPLAGHPKFLLCQRRGPSILRDEAFSPRLRRFVDLEALDNVQFSYDTHHISLRIISLNHWLKREEE
jgi:asparagine synthase (glutamine-hydrolysing)